MSNCRAWWRPVATAMPALTGALAIATMPCRMTLSFTPAAELHDRGQTLVITAQLQCPAAPKAVSGERVRFWSLTHPIPQCLDSVCTDPAGRAQIRYVVPGEEAASCIVLRASFPGDPRRSLAAASSQPVRIALRPRPR